MGNIITSLVKKCQQLRTKSAIKKLEKSNKIIIDDNLQGNLKIDVQGTNNVIKLTNISIPPAKNRKIIYIYMFLAIIMKSSLTIFQ